MTLPVAVLAGGLATRLWPLTQSIPKSLVEVAGKPFAVHQIELLKRAGVGQIVYCIGYLGAMVRDELGDGSQFGVRIAYSEDGPRPLGTGGAVRRALPLLGPAFFVLYGDSYLKCEYGAVEEAFRASGKKGLMTVLRNEDRWDRSNVVFEGGRILRYDKKERDARMKHIDYGLGVLSPGAFDQYPWDKALDLATVYQDLLGAGDLAGFEVSERFYEVGSAAGLEETRALLSGATTEER
jgi:NDP-sugar pyrophosphorylase family protein